MAVYRALIRTHHITSRKKICVLRAAAKKHGCYALLRSGACPGVMYVEGTEEAVNRWVATVHDLRYKDFELLARPSASPLSSEPDSQQSRVDEVHDLKDFGAQMEAKGALSWWRKAMGYMRE